MASVPSPGSKAPPYAVDFEVVACGKAVPNSKRRIRWRFGFASPAPSSSGGATWGRGDEHEVTFVWSTYSGKSLILFDGEELKYDPNTTHGTEHSWQTAGRILRVTAQGQSLSSNTWLNPGLRKYDFFVDGKSYFDFPNVRGLASAGKVAAGKQPEISAPRALSKEDAILHQSLKQESKRDLMGQEPAAGGPPARRLSVQASALLIDFFDDFEISGNTHPSPQAVVDDPWASASAPKHSANPFDQPAAPPAPAVPTVDFFSAPAPAQGPPPQAADPRASAPAGAPPPPPNNPFSSGNFASGNVQGTMVTAADQGGNWGLQQGQGQGQGQPPPYTMAGGYGQGMQSPQGQPTQQNPWSTPSS